MSKRILKKGEVWKVDSRKGLLTIQLLEDVDESDDTFFEAKIIEGEVKYASRENNFEQKHFGKGTKGDVITMRTTLTYFKKLVIRDATP